MKKEIKKQENFTLGDRKEKALAVNKELCKLYPDAECALKYEGEAWKLLVMARLSAQCTDERVNIVCRDLFAAYPTVEALAEGKLEDIESIIRPCGLFRTKAKNIKDACRILVTEYGKRVPDDMETLLTLPGVGRKIANLLLGDIYGKGGIVADTHCMRISCRLGLADKKDPLAVEKALSPILPLEVQSDFCHRLVIFGRDICTARSPKCGMCPMKEKGLCEGEKENGVGG